MLLISRYRRPSAALPFPNTVDRELHRTLCTVGSAAGIATTTLLTCTPSLSHTQTPQSRGRLHSVTLASASHDIAAHGGCRLLTCGSDAIVGSSTRTRTRSLCDASGTPSLNTKVQPLPTIPRPPPPRDTMLHSEEPVVAVVPTAMHTVETSNPENLHGLWSGECPFEACALHMPALPFICRARAHQPSEPCH